MRDESAQNPLKETFDEVAEAAEAGDLTLGDLTERLGPRGFGPLMILLAALVILPTGMIPFLPAFVGLALILLAGQLMLGWRQPWLPKRLRSLELKQSLTRRGLRWARPAVKWLSRLLKQRAELVADGVVSLRIVALACLLAGAGMIGIGFIPALPMLLGLPVLVFGLALTMRDGVALLAGFAVFLPVALVVARQALG